MKIEHLATLAARPNIELRLLRFAEGLHPGMCSVIDIFDFPDDTDPSMVYLDPGWTDERRCWRGCGQTWAPASPAPAGQ